MNLTAIIQAVSAFVFGNRKVLLAVFGVLTVIFVASASRLTVDAGFNKMVPLKHLLHAGPRDYEKVFRGANRIAVAIVRRTATSSTRSMAKRKASRTTCSC
jgi:hypothetical protein